MGSTTFKRVFTQLTASLVLLRALSAGVEPGQVEYVGGTVPGLKEGAMGRVDMASEGVLRFQAGQTAIEIPYTKIDSYDYTQEVTHHLGVLPAIAVGMARSRKHRHFFRISYYRDDTKQVVVFEVPKNLPPILLAVLRARAPEVCIGARPHCQR